MSASKDRASLLLVAIAACCLVPPSPATAGVAPGDSAGGVPPPADSALAVPQRDIGDVLSRLTGRELKTQVETEPTPGLSLTILPSLGYNPSYGAFIGASVALGGWLGDPKTTLASAGSAGFSYSTTEQISVQFKSDFYLRDNRWALKGDWRYLDTSQPTYGLGPTEPGQSSYDMDFVLYRLHQIVFMRVGRSNAYFGFGYHFDRYDKIRDLRAEQGEVTPYRAYSGGTPVRTQSSGISANVLVDTRDNPINANRGLFWTARATTFNEPLGSDADLQSIKSDFRAYVRLPGGSRNVLAIWNYLWFNFGKAPYLDLPAIGWDTYGRGGRGYLQGRIRGTNQAYTEFEYRVRLSRNGLWGAVGFLNLMSTTIPESGQFGTSDPGYGVGLRVKFNKRTDTNFSVDAARGQDDTVRWFFGLQEVF